MYEKNAFLTSFQWRLFWGTFVAMFVVTLLQHLGFHPQSLIRPVPNRDDVMRVIEPKLDHYRNTFQLKKDISLVGETHAESTFDAARSYALIDMDSGEVLMEKNLSGRVPIASLTKIMSAVVALDLAQPDEYFTATDNAAAQIPTKIGVTRGEQLKLSELLEAMLMTSANDAAQVVADGIDKKYGEPVFVDAMNRKAQLIGLANTRFVNPQGFDDPNHYSSAEDLAILTHYALTNYPLIAQIVKQDHVILPADVHHPQVDLYNWNGLLDVYPNVSGVKIGNTEAAEKTMIVTARRGNKTLLAVLLGAPGILERDLWTAQLLDVGFEQTENLAPVQVTEEQLRTKYATWQYWN